MIMPLWLHFFNQLKADVLTFATSIAWKLCCRWVSYQFTSTLIQPHVSTPNSQVSPLGVEPTTSYWPKYVPNRNTARLHRKFCYVSNLPSVNECKSKQNGNPFSKSCLLPLSKLGWISGGKSEILYYRRWAEDRVSEDNVGLLIQIPVQLWRVTNIEAVWGKKRRQMSHLSLITGKQVYRESLRGFKSHSAVVLKQMWKHTSNKASFTLCDGPLRYERRGSWRRDLKSFLPEQEWDRFQIDRAFLECLSLLVLFFLSNFLLL